MGKRVQMPLFDMSEQEDEMKIFTDGGCNPNPGRGTVGIYCKDRFRCGLALAEDTTNNRMEYVALYGALKIAKRLGFKKISVYTDSKILATTFNNKDYSGGANKILHTIRAAIVATASDIGKTKVSVHWVPRESNVEADELTSIAYERDVWEGLGEIDKSEFMSDLKSKIGQQG